MKPHQIDRWIEVLSSLAALVYAANELAMTPLSRAALLVVRLLLGIVLAILRVAIGKDGAQLLSALEDLPPNTPVQLRGRASLLSLSLREAGLHEDEAKSSDTRAP